MPEATVTLLVTWESFYTIIGAAAATLTGLMFVSITLIAGAARERVPKSDAAVSAFSTPTVVHFCTTLVIAATLGAPWQTLWHAGLLIGIAGLGGLTYIIIVIRRTRHQTDYELVMEDWLWHTIFPFISYAGLTVSALVLLIYPALALFGIGAIAVLFLLTGIHNAWDTVTYLALKDPQPENKQQDQS
ncbi:MAG TPA: hypothetical protein VGD98_20300 [Ktedonobacteraceae bacterium]